MLNLDKHVHVLLVVLFQTFIAVLDPLLTAEDL